MSDPEDTKPGEPPAPSDIRPVSILDEMKISYLGYYSMSVIVARALPDVRDGLKPVHRRILYGMENRALYQDRPYKKAPTSSAKSWASTIPTAIASIDDSIVRMAQDFSMRYPLSTATAISVPSTGILPPPCVIRKRA